MFKRPKYVEQLGYYEDSPFQGEVEAVEVTRHQSSCGRIISYNTCRSVNTCGNSIII